MAGKSQMFNATLMEIYNYISYPSIFQAAMPSEIALLQSVYNNNTNKIAPSALEGIELLIAIWQCIIQNPEINLEQFLLVSDSLSSYAAATCVLKL